MDLADRLSAKDVKIEVGRDRSAVGQGKAGRLAARTRVRLGQEQSLCQAAGPVEQVVVEYGVLVIDSGTCAYHSLSTSGWIPGEAGRGTEVISGDAHALAQPRSPEIQDIAVTGASRGAQARRNSRIQLRTGNRTYVTVRPACIAHITQPEVKGQIGA